MRLVGLLCTPRDQLVRADVERWGCSPVAEIPHEEITRFVRPRVKDSHVMVFGSPLRRWAHVMETLRAAARFAPGYVSLRFYQPTCTIDVRGEITNRPPFKPLAFNVCPLVAEHESGASTKAHAIKKAVREGFRDLTNAEDRALRSDVAALEGFLAKMGRPG